MRKKIDYADILYSALRSPYGVICTVSNFVRARAVLYAARAKENNPELAQLHLLQHRKDPTKLLIVKGGPPDVKETK